MLAGVTGAQLRAQHADGEVVGVDGNPVDLDAPALRPSPVYLYRGLPDEFEVPFDVEVLHVDERLVVVDKPHFLATMPRGQHVRQTALVRLRREFGDDLAPAHRLDRLTAGVLLFTRQPGERSAYQRLFAERRARKEYRAVAPFDGAQGPESASVAESASGAESASASGVGPASGVGWALGSTIRVENRIAKTAGDLRALVVDGPVNAISDITLERIRDDGLGEYRLVPLTGRTHQLRLHMSGLGVPIVGDPLYPDVDADLAAAPARGDFSRPLRLIASSLAFTDPFTGVERRFTTTRT